MEQIADTFNVPRSGLKLIVGLIGCYPLTLLHRHFLFGKSKTVQNAFFATTGMGLIYWQYGNDIIHSFICTLAQWALCKFAGNSKYGVYTSFLFQFGYLLGGYKYTETESYDICWTMPGCVMCLRIGIQNFKLLIFYKKKT